MSLKSVFCDLLSLFHPSLGIIIVKKYICCILGICLSNLKPLYPYVHEGNITSCRKHHLIYFSLSFLILFASLTLIFYYIALVNTDLFFAYTCILPASYDIAYCEGGKVQLSAAYEYFYWIIPLCTYNTCGCRY